MCKSSSSTLVKDESIWFDFPLVSLPELENESASYSSNGYMLPYRSTSTSTSNFAATSTALATLPPMTATQLPTPTPELALALALGTSSSSAVAAAATVAVAMGHARPHAPPCEMRHSRSRTSPDMLHARPADDAHYPYPLIRKRRTLLIGGVCAWCASAAAMRLPSRPPLQLRSAGGCADWERFAKRAGAWWAALVRDIAPAHEVVAAGGSVRAFAVDIANALIEVLLRELRGCISPPRDLMAQVRSAKRHKAERFANSIIQAYRDAEYFIDE